MSELSSLSRLRTLHENLLKMENKEETERLFGDHVYLRVSNYVVSVDRLFWSKASCMSIQQKPLSANCAGWLLL
jgi:hypothetical protein